MSRIAEGHTQMSEDRSEMMSDTAIRLEGIGKHYRMQGRHGRSEYRTIRETLAGALSVPVRRMQRMLAGHPALPRVRPTEFWALRDVSFEVKRGEVIGIIGRNGAGKSTLLKILSRITEPTTGQAMIHGRVGSLLEVGTGFHPELTGGENIYLNGAILGMRRAEIARKFDEIVAFADLERFIDTPVKRYSSGMFMRLAFAVAAYLEPEILLIDEVLAVGDAQFQKKCLSKMHDIGQQNRTVLFVSHNMQAVTRLCERTILLDDGRVVEDGPSHRAVSAYLHSGMGTTGAREWLEPSKAPRGEIGRLRAVRVRNEDGEITAAVDIRKPVDVEMEFDVLKPGYILMPSFLFSNEEGILAFSAHDLDPAWRRRRRPVGRYVSSMRIPGNLLSEGMMLVTAQLETVDPQIYQFSAGDVVAFQVMDSLDGDSARGDFAGHVNGAVRPMFEWRTAFDPAGDQKRLATIERAGS